MCKTLGGPELLIVEEVPDPTPRAGEVVVDVAAAGVNYPDVLIIQGKYQVQVPPPFTPGHELAGVVSAVGEGVDLRVGQRVVANTPWGAFAEKAAVLADATLPLPDAVPFDAAAALLLTYGTAHHGLVDRARLQADETVVVLGAAGGVGVATIQVAKALGARVVAVASTEAKRAFCLEQGADVSIGYENLKDDVKRLTGGQGADVVMDPVGGEVAERAVRATGWNGRYLIVGFASGQIPQIPLNLVLLKGCQLVGVFWGSFVARSPQRHREHAAQLFRWLQEGKIAPPIHRTFSMDEAGAALAELGERRVQGKVLIEPGRP